jgi:alkanesulfonate monooxygenase SsuD/methylene tetrahydromethanopterin reductase-like flavin-dependent oxidoreductase (luciferase family)
MAQGSGRNTPVRFGWRLPMWDADGAPAHEWLPAIHAHLDALRGKYASIWLSDHFVPGAGWMSPQPDTLECWTATAAFAAQYPDYDFGQIVLGNSYRHPSLLAKMASTLQLLTGGRLILGIGAGWMESEYRQYGYPFPSNAERLYQFNEAVQIIRRMWTRSPASFKGRYYQIDEAYANPLPEPQPPIMIGAAGEQIALRIVARHADWWNLSGNSPADFKRKAAVLAEHCAAVGRDPTSILYTWQCQAVSLADSEGEARRIAERTRWYEHTPEHGRLIGTPEQIAERLAEYVDLGVRHFILRFLDFPNADQALRFAAEVAPHVSRT